MQHRVVILGAGMVGRAMAKDPCQDHKVVSVDRDSEALQLLADQPNLITRVADLTDADIVVGAVLTKKKYDQTA